MMNLTPVARDLILLNIAVHLGLQFFFGEPSDFLALVNEEIVDPTAWFRYRFAAFMPGSTFYEPYQMVTYMFLHADFTHLLMNMFGLYMFGSVLETTLGKKSFLTLYLAAGIGAYLLFFLVKYIEIHYMGGSPYLGNVPMLGASGCVFGIMAGFATLFPDQKLMLLIPPIPMKAKYLVAIFFAIDLFGGLGPFRSGIAHFAHIGGGIIGILYILYLKRTQFN